MMIRKRWLLGTATFAPGLLLAPVLVGYLQWQPKEVLAAFENQQMVAVQDGDGRYLGALRPGARSVAALAPLRERGWVAAPAELSPVFVAALVRLEDRHHGQDSPLAPCGVHLPSVAWRAFSSGGEAGGSGFMAQTAKFVVAAQASADGTTPLPEKLRQLGVACRLRQALARPDGQPDADAELRAYVSVMPVAQGGGGTTRGYTLGALTVFGRMPNELDDAEQLVLAATPKQPVMALKSGDEAIDCMRVHPSPGNRAYDATVARKHAARAGQCRVVLRALHVAPDVLDGERLTRAQDKLIGFLRKGLPMPGIGAAGNTSVNPVARLNRSLSQAAISALHAEVEGVAELVQTVRLARAAEHYRPGRAEPDALRVALSLDSGAIVAMDGERFNRDRAIGPLGPTLMMLAATLRYAPTGDAGGGLMVDAEGVLRDACGCAPVKEALAWALNHRDSTALTDLGHRIGADRLARAAALVGVGLDQADPQLARSLALGTYRIPARQWLHAARLIAVLDRPESALDGTPSLLKADLASGPGVIKRDWRNRFTRLDHRLLRWALFRSTDAGRDSVAVSAGDDLLSVTWVGAARAEAVAADPRVPSRRDS